MQHRTTSSLVWALFLLGMLIPATLRAESLPAADRKCLGAAGTAHITAAVTVPEATAAVIYIHGYKDEPHAFNSVFTQLRSNSALQPRLDHLALCFDDENRRVPDNAADLAKELSALRRLAPRKSIVLIAHSLGGILARAALNTLSVSDPSFYAGGAVTLLSFDTPWHGFDGPSDEGGDGALLWFAKPWLPNGIFDMRAKSRFFRKLYQLQLPRHVAIVPVFATVGVQALDYTQAPYTHLAGRLTKAFNAQRNPYDFIPEENQRHFWSALVQSVPGRSMYHQLMSSATLAPLTETDVTQSLERYFPRFIGDHRSVLSDGAALRWTEKSVLLAI